MKALLTAGANPDASAPGGFTALHVAAEGGDVAMVQELLDAGADATLVNHEGNSPADVAAIWNHTALVETLLHAAKDTRTVEEMMAAVKIREEAQKKQAGASKVPEPEQPDEAKAEQLKQQGNEAFKKGLLFACCCL